VGLVEVSLALTIGIMLTSAAVVAVKKNRDRAETVTLESEEELISAAADAYFLASCRAGAGALPTSVSLATLQAQGFLPRAATSPWGATWSVTYLSAPRRAQVSAALSSAPVSMVPWIVSYADGYSYSGSTVFWIHNIRIAADTASANAQEFKAMYESSTC
jgi:hypothetical protein